MDVKVPGVPPLRGGERRPSLEHVPEFLVEQYISSADTACAGASSKRARLAAAALNSEGTTVRYLRSILVPEDETCFYLYEAGSAEAVREAARRAGLQFERIIAAVAEEPEQRLDPSRDQPTSLRPERSS
jgi:hypothetical protein